jgi:hypothetical protein
MGGVNIPLPALQTQVPTPRDPLQEYGKVVSLRGMQQQQAAQQQEMEIKQQQQKDLAATTKAMLGWDPKSQGYDDLAKSVLQSGGSAVAAQAVQQHGLTIRKTASDIAKQDAETGGKQVETMRAKNDMVIGAIDVAKNVPDEQLGEHLSQTVQGLASKGLLSQDEMQGAQQLLQLPPAQMRQGIELFEKSKMGQKLAFDQEIEKRKTESAEWKDAGAGTLINTRTGEVKQGTPPVERQELQDYLSDSTIDKGKNKNAATFLAWKARQNPTALVLGNQLGPAGQGSALDQAAERYSKDGSLPAGFARSPGTTAAIIKRSADLHPDQDLAANKATFQADTAALKKVQSQFDQMNAFEGTALKNLDLFVQKAKAVPDLQVRFANVPLRMITGKMIGEQNQTALNAARQTAATEVARVLQSATGNGVLSDRARKEVQDILDGNLPLSGMLSAVDTLKQDIANRHKSYQDDIDAIRGRIGAKPQGGAAPAPSAGGFDWSKMPEHK